MVDFDLSSENWTVLSEEEPSRFDPNTNAR